MLNYLGKLSGNNLISSIYLAADGISGFASGRISRPSVCTILYKLVREADK